jgi:flagellar hook-basal body protein
MDRMIYLSMSGAKATMQRQETLANNLANVSTVGFRAELAAFRAVPVQGSGASTRVYALESTPGYDATPGQIAATGRNLDVAMKGNAWLAVQGLDGTEAYTRGGSLQVTAEGNLVTTAGLTVLGDAGPIQVPQDTMVSFAPRRHRQRQRDERPHQHDRPAQDGHAGRPAHARRRWPVPRRRRRSAGRQRGSPGRRRASKARTSARSRRWWR